MRYGGGNYFWVNDMTPAMVMHPTVPELDGQGLSGFEDPNGKRLFIEMVDTVKAQGQGNVEYFWPKPGFDEPVPKSSNVAGFEPWNWIVGTGLYIDDLDAMSATAEELSSQAGARVAHPAPWERLACRERGRRSGRATA